MHEAGFSTHHFCHQAHAQRRHDKKCYKELPVYDEADDKHADGSKERLSHIGNHMRYRGMRLNGIIVNGFTHHARLMGIKKPKASLTDAINALFPKVGLKTKTKHV